MAHNNLALALAKQGRSEEAIAQFQAATALHKYPPDQVLTLAFYELRVGHPQEAIEEAVQSWRFCRSRRSEGSSRRLGRDRSSPLAVASIRSGRRSYQNALRLNPENAMALIGSGLLALRQGQSELAVTQLMHAVKVEPNEVNFLLLAQALRRAGHAEQADSAVAEAQKISSDPARPSWSSTVAFICRAEAV